MMYVSCVRKKGIGGNLTLILPLGNDDENMMWWHLKIQKRTKFHLALTRFNSIYLFTEF